MKALIKYFLPICIIIFIAGYLSTYFPSSYDKKYYSGSVAILFLYFLFRPIVVRIPFVRTFERKRIDSVVIVLSIFIALNSFDPKSTGVILFSILVSISVYLFIKKFNTIRNSVFFEKIKGYFKARPSNEEVRSSSINNFNTDHTSNQSQADKNIPKLSLKKISGARFKIKVSTSNKKTTEPELEENIPISDVSLKQTYVKKDPTNININLSEYKKILINNIDASTIQSKKEEYANNHYEGSLNVESKTPKYNIKNLATYILKSTNYPSFIEKEFDIEYDEESLNLIISYQLQWLSIIPESLKDSVLSQMILLTFFEIFTVFPDTEINTIIFNGIVKNIDLKTGNDSNRTIISCRISRETFCSLKIDRLDAVESVKYLCEDTILYQVDHAAHNRDTSQKPFGTVELKGIIDKLPPNTNLMNLTWQNFECLICEFFNKYFIHEGIPAIVKQTRLSHDGGVDIIAFTTSPLIGVQYYIQVKKWTNEVMLDTVKAFYGTIMANPKSINGIIVTTSHFSKGAKEFAEQKGIKTINGHDLLEHLKVLGYEAIIVFSHRECK